MTTEDIAAEIYVRVVTNVINGRSKPWQLKAKEAEAIALGALEAAEVFDETARAHQSAGAMVESASDPD